jgi:simple sugar transport system ATP-binding protein
MEIADRITVLRRGRRVADLLPADVESRRELARLMVGREVVLNVSRQPVPLGDVVLELRDCSGKDARGHHAFRRITFAVRRGEVFSIVGVAGNGQAELIAAITGASRFTSGQARVLGRPVGTRGMPADAPIAYIPEDRTGTGSVSDLDLTENFLLTTYHRFCRRGLMLRSVAKSHTQRLLERFRIAAPGPETLVRHLSGGNLQKLILAREFTKEPGLIIADQPTHGLDIGATVEVWEELLRQRTQAGILLVSGDLTEALSLSDRIAVLFRGELMGILSAADEDAIAEIGPMMAGVPQT